ncbi:hypothetical protein ACSBR2_022468 [Camellia fascicularis]
MATDQRASRSPLLLLLISHLLLLLISLLIGAAAALASRRRWPFQLRFSSHRCCLIPIWTLMMVLLELETKRILLNIFKEKQQKSAEAGTIPSFYKKVDPVVYNMFHEDPGNVSYSTVGGLSDQIRELRESIELPLMNLELLH